MRSQVPTPMVEQGTRDAKRRCFGPRGERDPNLVDKFSYSPLLLSMRKMPLTTMS